MTSFTITRMISVAAVALVLAAPARGQTEARNEVERIFQIDTMIDQAVNNVSARYNLNRTQHEITRRMMHEGVKAFLRDHQDQIYPLIRDLARARFSGEGLTVEQRQRIGEAAQPLLDAAKKTILDENKKWREVLSDQQKRLHDWDLHEMNGQFQQIHDNLQELAQGKPVENPLFPPARAKTPEPDKPAMPDEDRNDPKIKKLLSEVGPVRVVDKGDVFDQAVENFIRDYQLDTSQQEAARSIGREYKQQAKTYRSSHEAQMKKLEEQRSEALKKGDIKTASQAEAALDKHNAQLRQFLEKMKQRLQSIPTKAQKLAYERRQQSDQEGKDKSDASKKPDQPKAPTAAGPEQSKKTDDQDSKTSPKPPASSGQPGAPSRPSAPSGPMR